MIETSMKAVKEIHSALQSGSKVYCHFKKGVRYQVYSVSGTGSDAWAILSVVGPINFFSRRVEGWEIIDLENIHDFSSVECNDKQRKNRDENSFKLLKELASCSMSWSEDDSFYSLRIPSYLWQEVIQTTTE